MDDWLDGMIFKWEDGKMEWWNNGRLGSLAAKNGFIRTGSTGFSGF
jgi:hypothetical protein